MATHVVQNVRIEVRRASYRSRQPFAVARAKSATGFCPARTPCCRTPARCQAAAPSVDIASYEWTGEDEFTYLDDRQEADPLPLPTISTHKRIVLVRHGQSTWNAEGRIQGSTDFAVLTKKGQDQAATTHEMVCSGHACVSNQAAVIPLASSSHDFRATPEHISHRKLALSPSLHDVSDSRAQHATATCPCVHTDCSAPSCRRPPSNMHQRVCHSSQ